MMTKMKNDKDETTFDQKEILEKKTLIFVKSFTPYLINTIQTISNS